MAATTLRVEAFAIASVISIEEAAGYFATAAERVKVSKTTVIVR